MSIWESFLYLIGKRPTPDPRTYHVNLSDSLQVTLSTIAQDEGRPEQDLIPELLNAGLDQYTSKERLWKWWHSLSPREQDVAAFVCLGYTNRQIAAQLGISPETVKDRLVSVFRKLNIKKRTQLRLLFANYDFSAWERQQ